MKKGYSELLLLDVNVLVALAWPNHQFHIMATRRLEQDKGYWATCALTQLGFIRLSSNPAAVGLPKSPWEAASLLAFLIQDARHLYLDSLPSPTTQPFLQCFEQIPGSKQVTDAYLVTLAKQNRARLLTFDSRLASLSEAEGSIEVLSGL